MPSSTPLFSSSAIAPAYAIPFIPPPSKTRFLISMRYASRAHRIRTPRGGHARKKSGSAAARLPRRRGDDELGHAAHEAVVERLGRVRRSVVVRVAELRRVGPEHGRDLRLPEG